MQRPTNGYRGGIRAGHHYTHNHHVSKDDDDENFSLSNSNSDEKDDDIKHSPIYSSIEMNNSDFELAIRNLRPSANQQKKIKTNLNISKQKADLPQLHSTNEENNLNKNFNLQISNENNHQDKQSKRWFPKPDVGHVDSDDFIRHNHVGTLIYSD
jgi:hypothetical protein